MGASVRNEALKACQPAGVRHLHAVERLPPQKLGCRPRCTAKRLGERVMARTFERQVAQLHVRVALLNPRGNSGARPRCPWPLWHSCVWGWGHLVSLLFCATKPRVIDLDVPIAKPRKRGPTCGAVEFHEKHPLTLASRAGVAKLGLGDIG